MRPEVWRTSLLGLILVGATMLLAFGKHTTFHIVPDGADADTAGAIGDYLQSHYPNFDPKARAPAPGKIFYIAPSAYGTPTVTFYEVVSPQDIAVVEAIAKDALQAVPSAKALTMEFYEKQEFVGGMRQSEHLVKSERIASSPS